MPPHGEFPRYITATDFRVRRWRRRFIYLRDVLSADPEVSGMHGGRMYVKGKHPSETVVALHVLTLEDEGGYFTGGTGTDTTV